MIAVAAGLLDAQKRKDRFSESTFVRLATRSFRKNRSGIKYGTRQKAIFSNIGFGASDCWYWTGSVNRLGYGVFGKCRLAHRESWILFHGEIPGKLHVLHVCDVRSCVNPDHLFLGTHQDNMRDMKEKGRRRPLCGEKNHLSKITEKQVAEIRSRYVPRKYRLADIARDYKITVTSAWNILNRKTWKHI